MGIKWMVVLWEAIMQNYRMEGTGNTLVSLFIEEAYEGVLDWTIFNWAPDYHRLDPRIEAIMEELMASIKGKPQAWWALPMEMAADELAAIWREIECQAWVRHGIVCDRLGYQPHFGTPELSIVKENK